MNTTKKQLLRFDCDRALTNGSYSIGLAPQELRQLLDGSDRLDYLEERNKLLTKAVEEARWIIACCDNPIPHDPGQFRVKDGCGTTFSMAIATFNNAIKALEKQGPPIECIAIGCSLPANSKLNVGGVPLPVCHQHTNIKVADPARVLAALKRQ